MPHHRRQDLLAAATAFCEAFAKKKPLEEIMGHFAAERDREAGEESGGAVRISAFEYGLPCLAPFLGRKFEGMEGVRRYFGLLADCLAYEDMRFGDYVVDAVAGRVGVKGSARFTWIEGEKGDGEGSWDEVFTYALGMVQQDGVWKVQSYEIWADSGAAYLARTGELGRVRRGV
ncbi:hypothetical protein F5Y15DRAFT_378960 [Xylariaceae sp. FL0016]|nr:hypothetical protein F5Y15DRAFT_378960 [Xylariaceae sp. FL0016]